MLQAFLPLLQRAVKYADGTSSRSPDERICRAGVLAMSTKVASFELFDSYSKTPYYPARAAKVASFLVYDWVKTKSTFSNTCHICLLMNLVFCCCPIVQSKLICLLNIKSTDRVYCQTESLTCYRNKPFPRKHVFKCTDTDNELQTALNMTIRGLARDLETKGILVIALNPGSVRTKLGEPNAPLSPQESVEYILDTIGRLDQSHHGLHVNYNGEIIPW